MKKILLLLSACFAMTVVSCNMEKDIDINTYGGKGLEFVHFENASDSWIISAEDESFIHNVVFACTYKYDKDVTYNVKVDAEGTTGVEGVDYKLPSKTVTIKAGSYMTTVPVEILYATTGEGFSLCLALDVEDSKINPVYGNTIDIKVNTDKITIDWNWLTGKWNALDTGAASGTPDGDTYSVSFSKVNDNTCTFSNLWGAGVDMTGTVDFEARTISFPGDISLYYHSSYDADMHFVAVDPENGYETYEDLTTPVVATMSPAGITLANWDLLLTTGKYKGYTWQGGYTTVITR